MRFLAEHAGESFAVADLARRVGQSRTTCQSVLQALEPAQWVRRTRDGYAVGPGLMALGAAARQGAPVVGLLRAAVRDLHDSIGCEILGYLPAGDRLVNVIRVGPTLPMSASMVEGQSFPLVPPYGLAFAAFDKGDLEAWIARVPGLSRAGANRLRRAAEFVRELGYSVMLDPVVRMQAQSTADRLTASRREFVATALDHDDLVRRGFDAAETMRASLLSAPIFGGDGKVCALIGVVFDATNYHRLPEMTNALEAACHGLNARLGARPAQTVSAKAASV